MMRLGIIVGSGFEDAEILGNLKETEVDTPFGRPSSNLFSGKVQGIDVSIIMRYGRKHEIPPSQVNDRANIFALKYEGCRNILSFSELVSLRDEMRTGDFIILNQMIDFTKQRKLSFFEKFEFGAIHTSMPNPFSEFLRTKVIDSCKELGFNFHRNGTVITVEGPRFPTKAESKMFRQFGDAIDMSVSSEAILANEAELDYASVGLVAACDSWGTEVPLSFGAMKKVISSNTENVKSILLKVIDFFSEDRRKQNIKNAILLVPDPSNPEVKTGSLSSLLSSKENLKEVTDIFYNRYRNEPIGLIAVTEPEIAAIAGILADRLDAGFALLQSAGQDFFQNSAFKGQKVLFLGSSLSNGETALGLCKLIETLGGKIHECAFVTEFTELNGRPRLEINNYNVFSVVEFKDNK